MPSKAPEAPEEKVVKPDTDTRCPASGEKLRMKDLMPVRFTPVPDGEPGKHMDPITKETFTNTSQLVFLAATGWAGLGDGVPAAPPPSHSAPQCPRTGMGRPGQAALVSCAACAMFVCHMCGLQLV